MPAEVFIQTGERSPMACLLKPLSNYFVRAFREPDSPAAPPITDRSGLTDFGPGVAARTRPRPGRQRPAPPARGLDAAIVLGDQEVRRRHPTGMRPPPPLAPGGNSAPARKPAKDRVADAARLGKEIMPLIANHA